MKKKIGLAILLLIIIAGIFYYFNKTPQSNAQSNLCSEGAITSACSCGGKNYSEGFCCHGVYFNKEHYKACPAGNYFFVDASKANDNGDGKSFQTAKKYIKSGASLMAGGDVLIIADGVYSGNENMMSKADNWELYNGLPNGSSNAYTIVKAQHDFGVIIDGGGTRAPWALAGVNYAQVQGLVLRNSGGSGYGQVMIWQASDHIKVIRCAGYDSRGDTEIFSIRYSEYSLFEECFAWGRGRYLIQFYENPTGKNNAYNIARRNVARFDYETSARPSGSFVAYWADSTYFQNNIAIDGLTSIYVPRALYNPNGTDNSKFDSNIVLNQLGWAGQVENNPIGPVFINNVFYDVDTNGLRLGGTATGSIVKGNTFGNIKGSFVFRQDAGTENVNNNIFFGSNVLGGLYTAGSPITDDYNVLYGNAKDFEIDSPGAHDYCSQNGNAFNPSTNGLRYLPRIESGSVLKTAGENGGQIGAQIIKRIGVSGTLYGEPGWDTVTNENLWPFPNEDKIKELMSQYNGFGVNGKRGFAADGNGLYGGPITLTSYIWEYLGNPCPPEICNYGSTPPPSSDTTPPTRSNPQPNNGVLPAGTTSATISLTTNENATCKYSSSQGVSYSAMTGNFSTTGATNHSVIIPGLQDGQAYNYYVKCIDISNNANTDDFIISFSIPQSIPNISLVLSADKNEVQSGDVLTYTLTYQNTTSSGAKNIIITNPIPQGVAYIANSATNGGVYDAVNSRITWTIPTLSGNASGAVSFRVTVE